MILNDIVDILEAEEYGIPGENLFYNFIADKPDNQIVIKMLPGLPLITKMDDAKYLVQFTIRNLDYDEGYRIATELANSFQIRDSRFSFNPNSGRKMHTRIVVSPFLKEVDKSFRSIFVFTVSLTTVRD